MERHLTTSEARQRFLRLVDEAMRGDEIVVTKRGARAAVLIGFDRLETLKSIARLCQDPEALRAMREASEDIARGRRLRTKRIPRVHELLKTARAHGLLRGG
jgi:prevent-host-death family protein